MLRASSPIGLALAAVAMLALPVHAASPAARVGSGHSGARTYADQARGVTVLLPRGWRIAREPLTPALSDPHEVLAAGTGPMPPGGPCAEVPTRAILASAPRGAFVALLERSASAPGSGLRYYPSRPARYTLPPAAAARPSFQCVGRAPLRVWWRPFRENGRAFYLLVSIGTMASPSIRREALAVVNSLRLAPGRTVGVGPWLRLPADWNSRSYSRPARQVLRAATARLPGNDDDDGSAAQAGLGPAEVLLNVVRFTGPRSSSRGIARGALPLKFARSDFPRERYEGQRAAALAVRQVVVHGQVLRVSLALGPGELGPVPSGQRPPSDANALIARANAVLETLVLAAR
jgi:hypothetical protein